MKNKNEIRIILYIGMDRPAVKNDLGLVFLKRLIRRKYTISGVIINPFDRLVPFLHDYRIPSIPLPSELTRSAPKIKKSLEESDEFRRFYNRWIDYIGTLRPDLGITMWSDWLPCDLYSLPRLGFINFHPSPLPEMRGMEPDTFTILEGRKKISGTIHVTDQDFDRGAILSRTREIPVRRHDTPLSILVKLNREGIKEVTRIIAPYTQGFLMPQPQNNCSGYSATIQKARESSYIDWEKDGRHELDRKLRAFCGQDIGIRLKAFISGTCYNVVDIETHRGIFPGKPGTCLGHFTGSGRFTGQPIIRIRDGIAVIRLHGRIDPLPDASTHYPEGILPEIIPARRRPPHTSILMIRRCIVNNDTEGVDNRIAGRQITR